MTLDEIYNTNLKNDPEITCDVTGQVQVQNVWHFHLMPFLRKMPRIPKPISSPRIGMIRVCDISKHRTYLR